MDKATESLSRYATELHYVDLPPEVVHAAKRAWRLQELMGKITVRENAALNAAYPEGWACRIEIAARGEEMKVAEMKYSKGHAKSPLTDAEVEAKFHRLVKGAFDEERTDTLLRSLWRLEEIEDVRTVLDLLQVKHAV